MRLEHGEITVVIQSEPGEASVAAHDRRGVAIADSVSEIYLSSEQALTVLHWLQQQEPILQRMADAEAGMQAQAVGGASSGHSARAGSSSAHHPSQAEGDLATVEQALGERPSAPAEQPDPARGKPSQAEGDLE